MSERRSPMPTDAAISGVEVSKRYGNVVALEPISFDIATGEFVAIVGPSGCGKSTLLHLIAALDRPTAGRLVVGGRDLSHLHVVSHYRRFEVGVVFQFHNLLPHISAGRNVELAMFATRRSSRERSKRAQGLLGQLGLADAAERTPSRLSGGERQRVAIARALANEPPILLADEPTGSLDADAAETVLDLFEHYRRERGATIVMATHDQRVLERAGRVIEIRGRPVDDLPRPQDPPVRR